MTAKKTVSRRNPEKGNSDSVHRISTADLCFDAKNPRLVEYLGTTKRPTQDRLLEVLFANMGLEELALSIAATGFWEYEPLIVAKEQGKLVVIEGNRRLAAVRLLLDADLRDQMKATDFPQLPADKIQSLDSLPAVVTTREKAWQHLGFKHVNGPAKWDSYAKAKYIATVKDDYGVPLEEIARQIGDTHQTVQRLYRALRVLEQAEREGVFSRDNIARSRLYFSHLYVGLGYNGIANFISLKDADREAISPVPRRKKRELGELLGWLYGDRGSDCEPVVQSQNPHLRQLDEVLQNPSAVDKLRSGLGLETALEASYGDERVFRTALNQAKSHLQKAKGTVTLGFHKKDRDSLLLAEGIREIANDLYEEMKSRSN